MNDKCWIFLDIDGVMTTLRQYAMTNPSNYMKKRPWARKLNVHYGFDEGCVRVLNRIVDISGAGIILTSDWQNFIGISDMRTVFSMNGCNSWPVHFVGRADSLPTGLTYPNKRALLISEFVKQNELKRFVIVDDMDFRGFMPDRISEDFFFLTMETEGLKQTMLEQKILTALSVGNTRLFEYF